VALTVFGGLLMLLPSMLQDALTWVFTPALVLASAAEQPLRAAVSPLVSQAAQVGFFGAAFTAVLLLISGRFVERALGWGVAIAWVAGAYGGAAARLLLTPGSIVPGFAASGGLFAVIGAYLMLYGIPRGLPLNIGGGRVAQVATLAGIWSLLQLAFGLASGGIELSVQIIEPLGGLAAGVALARPLLAWRYRRA
jgi:membrane associated rhomboid family serine protease